MTSIWDKPISHGEILKKIYKHLDLGVLERDHPFHTPVFGTVCDGVPRLRTIILRRFWRKNPRALLFHTHAGSPKVSEIRSGKNVAFAFYHAPEKLQVCVKGTAQVLTSGALHEEQWQATGLFSRRAYSASASSQWSAKPTSGLPEELTARQPTKEESELGKSNFAVVYSTIDSIDCLELDFRGNRRSLFVWTDAGELQTSWLTP